MNSIEVRFYKTQNKNPMYSSYTCFAIAISGRNYKKRTISHWFKVLVNKDDYLPSEEKAILKFLKTL